MNNSIWLLMGMGVLTAGGAAVGLALRKLATGSAERNAAAGGLVAGVGAVGIGAALAMHSSAGSAWTQLGFGMVFIAGVLVQARARSIRA